MKAPISWLKEYVDIDVDIETLCKKMVDIGLEIEEVVYLGENVTNTVVGQIKDIQKHPNADKLVVCSVDTGKEILQIVTNSKTVRVGDKVPVALDGATLASGQLIQAGELRGVHSDGMFCGLEELGITHDYYPVADEDGVLVLKKTAKVGTDVRKEVGLDDYVIDVFVTNNRPDCDSVYGLAREIAVALNKKCKPLKIDYTETDGNIEDYVTVEVPAFDLCPAYFMHAVKDVKVAESPLWMRERLAKVGLHGISNMVDITNYVLMEVGQPMHAFDEKDITDKTIIVRRAEEGEKIIPLDGKEYTLNKNNLVIADKSRAVGLAGIMGGANSGIKDDTSVVVFEAAKFKKENIRHSSRELGLRSDSSARFEKGVDVYSVQLGLNRALHLVQQLKCGDIVNGRIALVAEAPFNTSVEFPFYRIKQLLGIDVPKTEVKKVLKRLSIAVTYKKDVICCTIPEYRTDISQYCDIIEEIVRVYGYDNIHSTLLYNTHLTKGGKTADEIALDNAKTVLVGLGYNECVFYPFGGKSLYDKLSISSNADVEKNIRIKNPLGEELSLMRTTAVADMLQCVALNQSRKNESTRLFECGVLYLAESLPLIKLPTEQKCICLSSYGDGEDFESFKSDVLTLISVFDIDVRLAQSKKEYLHPGISADAVFCGETVASFGKVHPTVCANFGLSKPSFVAEINFDLLLKYEKKSFAYEVFGKYPPVDRDFALVVSEDVAAQELLDEIKNSCLLCEKAEIFDVYRSEGIGEHKKSLAISVRFRDKTKTLSDLDIESQIAVCLKNLRNKFGAELRE